MKVNTKSLTNLIENEEVEEIMENYDETWVDFSLHSWLHYTINSTYRVIQWSYPKGDASPADLKLGTAIQMHSKFRTIRVWDILAEVHTCLIQPSVNIVLAPVADPWGFVGFGRIPPSAGSGCGGWKRWNWLCQSSSLRDIFTETVHNLIWQHEYMEG